MKPKSSERQAQHELFRIELVQLNGSIFFEQSSESVWMLMEA
jgi:hypothetical protein